MAVLYVVICLFIIVLNIGNAGLAFKAIFVNAFSTKAVLGGFLGMGIKKAIRFGVARGLFSNEAGMGSTPHAHAIAKVKNPEDQGHVAIVTVFIDTFVILTLSALVILIADGKADGTGISLTQQAFHAVLGHFGVIFVAVALFFFAFSTIIGWYFFGEANVKYLFGKNSEESEVIHYIREVAWEQILNQQKEDLNRWLSNISYYQILSYTHIYKMLLCLTHYSETVKETELYKDVLELFKQFTFGTLKFQKGKEITTVFCSEKTLEELLSYIHSYGSISFEEFWQLLSETVGEEFEVELTILSGGSLVKNVTKQSYNEPEDCPEISLLPLKQLQEWKFVKLKLSDKFERELTNNFPINNSQYHSVSESLRIQCTLKQIIDLFPTEVSENVKEYYQLITQVYQFSKIPDFSEFIVKDVE